MRALFSELLGRTNWIEATGEPSYLRSNFQRGVNRLPICWTRRACPRLSRSRVRSSRIYWSGSIWLRWRGSWRQHSPVPFFALLQKNVLDRQRDHGRPLCTALLRGRYGVFALQAGG